MLDNKQKKIGIFSSGIMKIPTLTSFLEVDEVIHTPETAEHINAIAGWGRKPNTSTAINFAAQHKLPYLILEDGFLHSCGQGVLGDSACSMIIDHTGIYYDATTPSDLEILLSIDPKFSFDDAIIRRAQQCIGRIRNAFISKYNNTATTIKDDLLPEGENILVVDQTAGDMSLQYGYADSDTFSHMLQTALDEHPAANIIIKTHPDVIAGKKKGYLSLDDDSPRITVIADNLNPLALIKHVKQVYVATSQMGFEALMLGKPVTCFGVPFYAGWGLTDDRADKSLDVWARRKHKLTLEQVFYAAYIRYTHYIHPDTLQRCEIENVLSYFELQKTIREKTSGRLFCFGFTLWKRNYIRGFLQSPDNEIYFISSAKQAIKKEFNAEDKILCWSSKDRTEAECLSQQFDVPIHYMEDGFIRSVGIGSDLTAPASLVLDSRGTYYDPSTESDLESILQEHDFDDALLARAEKLRVYLLETEVSKYNAGTPLAMNLINPSAGQSIILIPGQVEDDASIQTGCINICTNSKLIIAVRESNPDAYIIFKPHPDVVSGNRKGAVENDLIEKHCDLMLDDVSVTDCLGIADEVHTMTSLVGFEGLMRHLKVVCYGLPFYSNWGLTQDRHYLKRRNPHHQNKKTLNELVAATLILYPRYINWQTGAFTTPEFIVQQITKRIKQQGGKQANKMPTISRKFLQARQLVKGVVSR